MANWEIVLEGRQGGNDNLNVFHYQDNGGGLPPWDQVADAFRGHIVDHLQSWCSTRVSWLGITVREDIVGGVGTFVPFTAGTLTGTNVDGDHADVLAMRVKKLSGGLVRPTYGWFMQGGITARATTGNNTWETAVMDDVGLYAADIRVINVGVGITLTMAIKASNPTAPNTQAYSPVADFTIAGQPRTQRTRLNAAGS